MKMQAHYETGLGAFDIDLWLAYYDEIADPVLLARLREHLSHDERDQEMRYHFADDRKRYRVTRSLVRTVLSRYAALDPADWTFAHNHYGRPEIAATHGCAADLRFNLSHTRGLIVLGVTRHRELGVDVEHLNVRNVSAGLADHFFAPQEAAVLASLPAASRKEAFFEYWTFKEAYVKARGMGFSLPFEQFSFDFPTSETVRFSVQRELGDDARRWSFWQFRPGPEYLLAVCAERLGGSTPRVRVRRIVPGGPDETWPLPVLKSSEPLAHVSGVGVQRLA